MDKTYIRDFSRFFHGRGSAEVVTTMLFEFNFS